MMPQPGDSPNMAIIRLPHISNFTDFRLLSPLAAWILRPAHRRFDCIILPGTKNTPGDLAWLRSTGLDEWILSQHRAGAQIIGVCGGYQMMGESVDGIPGLGLLPIQTEMREDKTVRLVEAVTASGVRFSAYEIHMGETTRPANAAPFAVLADGTPEGIRSGRLIGTYLHGALENAQVASEILGLPVSPAVSKQQNYQLLADWFDRHQRGFAEIYL
jgi:adenosylcobyric acid synthase